MTLGDKMEDQRPILYIAGPYRANTVDEIVVNILEARRRMRWAWLNGYIPICPHMNSALIDGLTSDEVIMDGYIKIVSRCDAIMMIGWSINSTGALAELKEAKIHGLMEVEDPYTPYKQTL